MDAELARLQHIRVGVLLDILPDLQVAKIKYHHDEGDDDKEHIEGQELPWHRMREAGRQALGPS